MKRLCWLVIVLLLLAGCGNAAAETTMPETIPPTTESAIPWIQEMGTPWDEEGALTELPLTIPDGLHYSSALNFSGDLLLWSIDDHRENVRTIELCLVELDTGTVTARRDLDFAMFLTPQVLGENLYLCDSTSGTVLQLDQRLELLNSWSFEPVEGNVFMGAGERLFIYGWDGTLTVQDLNTGTREPLIAGDPYIDYFTSRGECASIEYFDPVSGESRIALLDMRTGSVLEAPLDSRHSRLDRRGDTWLCELYRDGYIFYIGDDTGNFSRADMGFDSLQLVDRDTLLCTREDGCYISLHDLEGRSLAQAKLTASPYSHSCSVIIPSDTFGGYFLLVGDYSSSLRLLYWDTSRASSGEDIPFEPVPEPGEAETEIRQRIERIKQTYGLNILVADDCETYFLDFSAELMNDWEMIRDALDVMEAALENYPDGFFRQLRYDTIHSIEIQLTGTLTATNAEYVDTYEAFVQEEYDRHVMVVDVLLAGEQTYYHEFSHIIDSYLEWDSNNREDALFSEEGWNDLNPNWFPGYTWDYSWQQYVQDYTCFVDSYSTIRPTEDRARVLEYAMAEYGAWTFEDAPVLQNKLAYYCRCIRDAFDTTGWPETVLWEQYLP